MKNITIIKITCILLVAIIIYEVLLIYNNLQIYDFGNIKLKKSTLDNISENFAPDFKICNIKTGKCIRFGKIDP